VRTRRWVWRQGEKAKVTEASRSIFFPIDGFNNVSGDQVLAARNELAELLAAHLGGEVRCLWVDANNPIVEL
jgi:DNA/RNA-binding domain of Phe-tRNA-synthetase-like protein